MLVLYLCATLVAGDSVVAAAGRDVYYQGNVTPLNITPTFDKGYLIVYNRDHKINVFGPGGSLLYTASAHSPDGSLADIDNAAVDADGTLAGAVYGRGGIALFDRAGTQIRFFETGQYMPTEVCFAPDRSIWTLGWQGMPPLGKSQDDYFVLRRYSKDGQQLGAYLPRSSFESEPEPVGPMTGGWQLRITNERVGALFYSSSIYRPGQARRQDMLWIETDLNGKEVGRWNFNGDRDPLAVTQSGIIYGRSGNGIAVFDRTTKSWHPVSGMPDGSLLGADRDSLVFLLKGKSVLRWVTLSPSM